MYVASRLPGHCLWDLGKALAYGASIENLHIKLSQMHCDVLQLIILPVH